MIIVAIQRIIDRLVEMTIDQGRLATKIYHLQNDREYLEDSGGEYLYNPHKPDQPKTVHSINLQRPLDQL